MNYLGHAYLSFGHPSILVGNMISDFVKGGARFNYAEEIQKGIMLHRQIDAYTDAHRATASAKEIFRPHYRLYSGAVMDVIYDHYLATHPEWFTKDDLLHFTLSTYGHIESKVEEVPPRFAQLFSYMKAENWLYNYRQPSGISRSLQGLVRRSAYLTDSHTAYQLFLDNYDILRDLSHEFLADVKNFAKEKFTALV